MIFFILIQILNETSVNSEEPDQTPRFAASNLVLRCLPMSHKKDSRLIWVNKLSESLHAGYFFMLSSVDFYQD